MDWEGDETLRQLLLSVAADPADDTVRLAYADRLDEHGEHERAEFIRVQVELARLGGCDPVCSHECGHRDDCRLGGRAESLRRRERELWAVVGESFALPGRAFGVASSPRVHWGEYAGQPIEQTMRADVRRGFVEKVTCTAADWLAHGDEVCRTRPVTRVALTTVPLVRWDARGGEPNAGRFCWFDARRGRTLRVPSLSYPEGAVARIAHALLADHWPGVVFSLPTISGTGGRVTVGGASVPVGSWRVTPVPPPAPPG